MKFILTYRWELIRRRCPTCVSGPEKQ